ncbi:MAG: exosortase system-associated protein, TIGR04073 family [Candidatus Lernaella stagnicola]|nr:exosortase system-associated protein, TIGR04073 family [Candidatus Lernaella stagnicola]
MKRIGLLIAVSLLLSLAFAGMAQADDYIGGHIISSYSKIVGPYPSPFFDATKKLGRGLVNIGTGPIELLKQPVIEAEKGESVGEFLTGLTYGVFAGVAWTFYRELDGIYEVTTFYLPSLDPAINPEYIF